MSPTHDLEFRDARRADLPAIVDMLSDDFLGSARDEDPGRSLGPAYFAAFDEIESDPNNRLIVAQCAGQVIGCLQLTFAPGLSYRGARRAIIEGVRIASPMRGRGFGRQLVSYAIEAARLRGTRFVQLTTNKRRLDAQRFYASLGFCASHEGFKFEL